jgi:hypothetical protein
MAPSRTTPPDCVPCRPAPADVAGCQRQGEPPEMRSDQPPLTQVTPATWKRVAVSL